MARQVATFKMAIASRVKMQIDNNVDMTRVSSSVRHMPQIMWDKPKNTPNINSTPIQKKSRATNQGGCLILFLRELDLVYHVSSLDWGYASCWNEVDDDGARSSVCKWSRGISIKCSFVKRYCTSCRMIYTMPKSSMYYILALILLALVWLIKRDRPFKVLKSLCIDFTEIYNANKQDLKNV